MSYHKAMSKIGIEETMLTLENRGPVLETARQVSCVMDHADVIGAIIGGVAVVLHGHVRTTIDVDVFTDDPRRLGSALRSAGYSYNAGRKQFKKDTVPVHLATLKKLCFMPRRIEMIDGIRTVSLADLVGMKLRSGLADVLRAQDLADVINLIHARRLKADFAANLEEDVRGEFRKLVQTIERRRASRAAKAKQ
jgi:hypothetical protein